MTKKRPNFIFIVGLITTVLVDQLTKFIFQSGSTINSGIAFGWHWLGLEPLAPSLPFLLIIILFIIARSFLVRHQLSFGLFFGGALSNLIDRLVYGGVRDFMPLPLTHLSNNLADWAITFGLAGFIFSLFFIHDRSKKI